MSLSARAHEGAGKAQTYSVPLNFFLRLESESPGAAQKFVSELEKRVHDKIYVSTHEETGFVDLTCFDCDVRRLHSTVVAMRPKNDAY